MQQPAYPQHQNMDPFPPPMMAMPQDPVHHQVQVCFLQLRVRSTDAPSSLRAALHSPIQPRDWIRSAAAAVNAVEHITDLSCFLL